MLPGREYVNVVAELLRSCPGCSARKEVLLKGPGENIEFGIFGTPGRRTLATSYEKEVYVGRR